MDINIVVEAGFAKTQTEFKPRVVIAIRGWMIKLMERIFSKRLIRSVCWRNTSFIPVVPVPTSNDQWCIKVFKSRRQNLMDIVNWIESDWSMPSPNCSISDSGPETTDEVCQYIWDDFPQRLETQILLANRLCRADGWYAMPPWDYYSEGAVNFKSEGVFKSSKTMTSACCSVRLWPHFHWHLISIYTPTWHRILLFGKNSGFPNPAGSHPLVSWWYTVLIRVSRMCGLGRIWHESLITFDAHRCRMYITTSALRCNTASPSRSSSF